MTSPITVSPGFRVLQTINKSACPVEMAVADVNGDGLPDVVVDIAEGSTCLPGQGGASFVTHRVEGSGSELVHVLAVADVNGDGRADLISRQETPSALTILFQQASTELQVFPPRN